MRSGRFFSLKLCRYLRVLNKIMVLYLSDCINLFLLFFYPACMLYRKVTKLWDARTLCCNLHVPKIQEKRQSLWVFRPIHANWRANCEGPDQTALLGALWSGSALFAKARLSVKIQDHNGNYSKILTRWLTMSSLKNIINIDEQWFWQFCNWVSSLNI